MWRSAARATLLDHGSSPERLRITGRSRSRSRPDLRRWRAAPSVCQEWTNGMARQPEHADRNSLPEHWSGDHAAIAAKSLQFAHLVFRIGSHIAYLYSCALEHGTTDQGLTSRLKDYPVDFLFELRSKPVVRLGL